MDLTRRELLVLAAVAVLPLPEAVAAPPPPPPEDPFAGDELPLQGSAGECSGRH